MDIRRRSHRRDPFEYSAALSQNTTIATPELVGRPTTNMPPITSERPRELLQPAKMSLDCPLHARHILNRGLDPVDPSDP